MTKRTRIKVNASAENPEEQRSASAETPEEKQIDSPDSHFVEKEDATQSDPPEDGGTAKPDKQAHEDPLEKVQVKLEAAEQEAKDTYDRLLRVSAEFENYKKRNLRQNEDLRKFANESLCRDLLSVVDNLERAIEAAQTAGEQKQTLFEGVVMTHKEILKVLEKYQVKPFEALGQVFDPSFHQAMMQQEVEDQPDNMVIQELQKGYMIHDRLLRPAMVVVSKSKTKAEANENVNTSQ